MANYIPTVWKSGGMRPPFPPHNCAHDCNHQENEAQNWQGGSGTLKAAQKLVVLFISRVDPETTQEEVEKFANIIFQTAEIHCEKLKTRYNFYASFKDTLQGVEMEDALSSHIWPTGIIVKKFFYGRTLSHKKGLNNQHPTTVNNGSKKWRIVSSYLQQSWLDSTIAWHWATLCYVSHNFSPRNLAGLANIRQTDWYQW